MTQILIHHQQHRDKSKILTVVECIVLGYIIFLNTDCTVKAVVGVETAEPTRLKRIKPRETICDTALQFFGDGGINEIK